jgi:hypothetical protein
VFGVLYGSTRKRAGSKTGDRRLITFTPYSSPFCSKVVIAVNLIQQCAKRFLDLQSKSVVNRRPSGLVRFSYKLSIFQIGGLVICGPEATRV